MATPRKKVRPCSIEWIRGIVAQCKAAGVPCFVKQVGSKPVQTFTAHESEPYVTPMLKHPKGGDPKGGDPSEWPEDLRVRQFPL